MGSGGGRGFKQILSHFQKLQARWPPLGLFLEPTKIILVLALRNVARADDFYRGMGIKVIKGSCYIRVLFGYKGGRGHMAGGEGTWVEKFGENLSGVTFKHPQSSYAGLQKSLQQEWVFVQRVTLDIRDAFGPVEQALRDAFIPALLQGLGEGTPGRGVTRLPVKQAGLALPYPKKWPLITVRRPVSSQDTSSQRSGASRSSRRRITLPTSERGYQRWKNGASCRMRSLWQRPYRVPLSKAHVFCGGRQRRGHGWRCSRYW